MNEVALACVDDRRFMVLMAMAKRRGVQEVKQLMAVAESVPEAVARVQRTVGQAVAAGRGAKGTAVATAGVVPGMQGARLAVPGEGGGAEVGGGGTSDDRSVTGWVTVSLEDPLNPGHVIKHPGRFSNSSVLQPFDLNTYLREVSGVLKFSFVCLRKSVGCVVSVLGCACIWYCSKVRSCRC